MIVRKLQAFFNPEQYHGWGKNHRYFEGWYFKVLNLSESHAFAFIPGIAMDEKGNKHAFIQVLDGMKSTSEYYQFEAEKFKASPGKFELYIENNFFSENEIRINLPGKRGNLSFSGNVPWPKHWYSPGIMGPYSFVPFMECYHGIVSMDHKIKGVIESENNPIDFTGGRGYIEKDWGRSFPEAYVWMQSNHFTQAGISFKSSVARIPWIRNAFTGFIAGLWINDQLIRFTTYNKSRLIRLHINEREVTLILENDKYRLEVIAVRKDSALLASPIRGFMEGRIEESMTSFIYVKLFSTSDGEIIFEDTARHAGLEVAGNIDEITTDF